jgi:hypothetical protein
MSGVFGPIATLPAVAAYAAELTVNRLKEEGCTVAAYINFLPGLQRRGSSTSPLARIVVSSIIVDDGSRPEHRLIGVTPLAICGNAADLGIRGQLGAGQGEQR